MKNVYGEAKGAGKKISVVVSKFNEFITKRLLERCLEELKKRGVKDKDMDVYWVPGSFEIPLMASRLAKKKNVDAVIALGAVIRGETFHFELVAHNAASGILWSSLSSEKPVIFGVITTDTVDQAYKRSEKKGSNKGSDAALAALEMIDVLSKV